MRPAPPWTEARVQDVLARHFHAGGGFAVPNCGAYGWEADLIRVTARLFASEYEVKLTRADFLADARKTRKRLVLAGVRKSRRPIPNYFFYAAPAGLIAVAELPEYAGLIEVVPPPGKPEVRKAAPRLHGRPLALREALYLARGASLRYWGRRAGTNETPPTEAAR